MRTSSKIRGETCRILFHLVTNNPQIHVSFFLIVITLCLQYLCNRKHIFSTIKRLYNTIDLRQKHWQKCRRTGNDGLDDHIRGVSSGLHPEYTSDFLIGVADVDFFLNWIVRDGCHRFQLKCRRSFHDLCWEELQLWWSYHAQVYINTKQQTRTIIGRKVHNIICMYRLYKRAHQWNI